MIPHALSQADRERQAREAKTRVQSAERELAAVRESIRVSHPDVTGEPLEKLAHALVMAQARLEVAKIRAAATT